MEFFSFLILKYIITLIQSQLKPADQFLNISWTSNHFGFTFIDKNDDARR